jgi:MFS family permease
MILGGIGGGMFVAPNISSIMNSTPVNRRGIASGMSATLVTTGALLSLAMAFTVLATNISPGDLQKIFAGVPVGTVTTANPYPYLDKFVPPMHIIFLIMGLLSLVAAIPSVLRGSVHDVMTLSRQMEEAATPHAPATIVSND